MKKQFLKASLKILVALGLLAWFLYRSDISKIIENISSLSLKFFLSALIVYLIFQIVKSFRWRLFLPQYPLGKLVDLGFISQFYSIISAGQFVGELAKVYILGKGQKEAGQIVLSVFIDKTTGIIGVIIVAVFGLIFSPTILSKNLILAFAIMAIFCLISIFLVRLEVVYKFLDKFLNNWLAKADKLKRFIGWAVRLLEAWYVYSKKIKIIFISIALSIIFHFILIEVYVILGYGFGINISFWDWCWILGILSGLIVLPITIGGIGVREGSLVGLLGIFTVAPEKALALSFSVFAVQIFPAFIGGLIEARRTKIIRI